LPFATKLLLIFNSSIQANAALYCYDPINILSNRFISHPNRSNAQCCFWLVLVGDADFSFFLFFCKKQPTSDCRTGNMCEASNSETMTVELKYKVVEFLKFCIEICDFFFVGNEWPQRGKLAFHKQIP
jgi:hypothetical protein